MNEQLLKLLSNTDAVASNEDEVRDVLFAELNQDCDEIMYDNLGSMIFHQQSANPDGLKLMFAAHMDEVGFLVRHISDIGFVYVIALGGVLDISKQMQKVRITTQDGLKIYGLLNVTKDDKGNVKEMYVDIGCDTSKEVADKGIEIGDMVCFASEFMRLNDSKVYAGKAMDDRVGCYVIAEALKQLTSGDHSSDLYMCATSSEEVGIRGGKTTTYQINPDIVIAIDVANNPELKKDFTNHRQIGKGCMIVHYDKTMAPNPKLVRYVKAIAQKHNIPYQSDMFSGGGTDAGNAHLSRNGKLALVIGVPLRYCHGSYSYVHEDDLNSAIELVVELVKKISKKDVEEMLSFNRRKM